ncbi:endonuclease/exonuclease/phosphatase family protein [Streptomyces albus]|uniref:endonuclease/exonuclease/phosphatase family protein n=1 Tax=Streptomyces albus TaxID=1888 RepID=UPI003F1E3700
MNSAVTTTDELRVACWNIEHNGRPNKPGDPDRRPTARKLLSELRPHILLRQELTGADADGSRALYEEATQIGGLIPFMAPATPESPNATGVMVDPEHFEVASSHDQITGMWHPACNPVVRLKGCRKPICLASVHLSPWDPTQRASEARRLTFLANGGRTALFGGDMNSYPHRVETESVELPDWDAVKNTDPGHYERRTIERGGRRVPDTVPDEVFTGSGIFTELAHHAATVLKQPDAMQATASLWRTDQGHRSRIDRLYCTPDLAPALLRVEVLDEDPVAEASDHALLLATFSLQSMRRILLHSPT